MDEREPPQSRPPGPGDDGVRITRRPRRRGAVAVGVAVLAVIAVVVGVRLIAGRAGTPEGRGAHGPDGTQARLASGASPASTDRPGSPPAAPRAVRAVGATQAGVDGEDPTADLSDYVLPGEAPTMPQVIDALHRRGIRSGLGAFPPPGTSPPLVGLEVPDGFALPEGYVRHQQATDDGQRIAPILMFAPDFQLLDAQGRPVRMPVNRVVPPELAPPGMPRRIVRIPAPRDGSGGP